MKYLFLTTLLFSLNSHSEQPIDCSDIVRAPNQDQINLLLDISFAPQVLGLSARNVYSSKVLKYDSWKAKQNANCLADVVHRAEVEVRTIQGAKICTNTLVAHRKDVFTNSTFTSEYKIRDKKEVCVEPTQQEAEIIKTCQAAQCGVVNDTKTFADHLDGCKCKLYDEAFIIQDKTGLYEGFFNLETPFPKPADVESPFSN
jgi:hypothetical protein